MCAYVITMVNKINKFLYLCTDNDVCSEDDQLERDDNTRVVEKCQTIEVSLSGVKCIKCVSFLFAVLVLCDVYIYSKLMKI